MRAILRSAVLAFGLLAASTSARAEAPATPHDAAAQVRPRAAQVLSDAQRSAMELRTRAAAPEAVRAAQTKAVRHDIATKIVISRKELRQTTTSLRTAEGKHAVGVTVVGKTESEMTDASAQLAVAKADVPTIIRFAGFGLTASQRSKLARYEEAKGAYEILAARLTQEKHHVAEMATDVKTFETTREALVKQLGAARGRDWKAESTQATAAQLQALMAEADHVEADAKKEIHSLVSTFVASKYSLHRMPLAQAHAKAESTLSSADRADSQIGSADSALDSVSSALAAHQMNAMAEAAFGKSDFTRTLGTMNHFSENAAASTAQSRLRSANDAVSTLNDKVSSLKAMTAKLQMHAPGVEGQVARVDADVATVAFVDLVLSLSSSASPLMDVAMGEWKQSRVSQASSDLARMRRNVREIRASVRTLHGRLGESLAALDAEAAKVVEQAVADVLAEGPARVATAK
jgi:hypothetical protein